MPFRPKTQKRRKKRKKKTRKKCKALSVNANLTRKAIADYFALTQTQKVEQKNLRQFQIVIL